MMADMPSEFWGGWIAVLTVVSVLGLIWLVVSVYFFSNHNKESESPVWDETLREGFNPAPMWWFWMMFISLIISVIYLILYPGLGSYKGALHWSQGDRLHHSIDRYNKEFASMRNQIAQTPIIELQSNAKIMVSAERIYLENCAACHGRDASGQANVFPNLLDDDWQWGGTESDIEYTIKNGRNAIMIGWTNIIGEEGVLQLVNYIQNLGKDLHNDTKGHALYKTHCAACHGQDGKGNTLLGAPNLTDDIWLYGNSDDALQHTISIGRNGVMPAFGDRLDDAQIRMLTAWLLNN